MSRSDITDGTPRERRLASTDEEREAAAARLRVAMGERRRLQPQWDAAVAECGAAALEGRRVGLSVREMADVAGVPFANVQRWIRAAAGAGGDRAIGPRRPTLRHPQPDPRKTTDN